MFQEKRKVLLSVFLAVCVFGGVFILYNVFQDVESWEDIEQKEDIVVKIDKNTEKEEFEEEKIEETVTTTIKIVEKEVIVEKIVEKIVYVEKEVEQKSKEEQSIENNLTPVVVAESATCPTDMRFQCWDLLSCNDYGDGYGSPALWTANTLEDVAPSCGQWATDSAKLPTSWSCCCGYNEDWQKDDGNKTCYSPVYTSNLTFE